MSFADRIGSSPVEGDMAFRFVDGRWSVTQYSFGAWSPFVPDLTPNEGVFFG